jgi:hypothetical protein
VLGVTAPRRARRGLVALLIVAVVAGSTTAGVGCSRSRGGELPGDPGQPLAAPGTPLTVGATPLAINRPPGHLCLHGRAPGLRSCVPIAQGSTEDVLSAVLQPFDAVSDLLLVVTTPEVRLLGLDRDAVRAVVPGRARVGPVVVWVELAAAGTARICATVTGRGGPAPVVIHRSVEVDQGGARSGAVDDEC